MQHDRNMTVSVTKATALNQTAAAGQPSIHIGAFDETSLAHFCAFMDLHTRQCHDPFSTSLTCAKQAEVVQITPEDLTPETIRQVIQTMLSVVDHLEKKWLDEQIQHEERMQRHRDDVARLSQQLRVLQSVPSVKGSFARRGLAWLQDVISRPKISRVRHASRKPGVKRRHALEAVIRGSRSGVRTYPFHTPCLPGDVNPSTRRTFEGVSIVSVPLILNPQR